MIYVMNNECGLDRNFDVVVGVEFPEPTRVSGDTLDEQRINCSNRVFHGGNDGEECCTMIVGSEETRVSSELDPGELESKVEVRASEGGVLGINLSGGSGGSALGNVEVDKRGSEEARVLSGFDFRDIDGKLEVRVSSEDGFSDQNTGTEHLIARIDGGAVVSFGETKVDAQMEERTVPDFDFSDSSFDEGATEMPGALGLETSKSLNYGFEAGDMVWGKVKSHPWWPGNIFNEAFALPSVQRMKREGHVLVAFFGDSSYGWFDPAELIPFEPHYAEKSRQTNSRNFVKAVEEAIDETRRRRALGLACYCRNPFNFRPTNVQGYYAVDMGDYEPGGVYSVKQIKRARDSFQPEEALSFVMRSALMPRNSEQSIDWIKNMTTVIAYRKAVFEEFDETYAQAFGLQPVRPSRNSMGVLDQASTVPSRAPLSGPLVIAEVLGKRKNSTKHLKVKDQSKKDKYLFKRRDEPNLTDLRADHISHDRASFLAPSAYKEGAAALSAGDYVFEKRAPSISMKPHVPGKQEGIGTVGRECVLSRGGTGKEAITIDKKLPVAELSMVDGQVNMSRVDSPAGLAFSFPMTQPPVYSSTLAAQGGPGHANTHQNKGMSFLQETKGSMGSDAGVGPMSTHLYGSDLLGKSESPGVIDGLPWTFRPEGESMVDLKNEETGKLFDTSEGLQHPKPRFPTTVEDLHGSDEVGESGCGMPNAKLPGRVIGTSIDGVVKKVKVLQHLGEGSSSRISITGEKKKKKKKRSGLGTSLDWQHKRLKAAEYEESVRKSAGKSIGKLLVPIENSHMDQQRKDDEAGSSFHPDSLVTPPVVDIGNTDFEIPQLLSDLLALALDPFHGVERNGPAIVRHVLLRFRSLVYQKSLDLAPPAEVDSFGVSATKSQASTGTSEPPPIKDVRNLHLASKPPKPLFRPSDPTKAGRKRSLSNRQEEISAKRLKKLNDLKSLAAEKKASNQKTLDVQREERKEMGVPVLAKPIKPDFVKKVEPPSRLAQPMMLVMKFPPRTTLPSVPELKARFARFGPLDHSATRVFWKTSTCRILFKHKSHAQTAHNYAVRNNSLFGNVKVKYSLRDLEVPEADLPESSKQRAEDASNQGPRFKLPGANDSGGGGGTRPAALMQRPLHQASQLKSCLKKPSGDESGLGPGPGPGPAMGVQRESPRVKFMLDGEESSRGEQLVVSSIADGIGGASSSSLAIDINTNNKFRKVNPQSLPPLLPLPPPRMYDFPKAAHHAHFSKVEARNNPNYNTPTNNIDISHEMLSLLLRCSHIVNDVNCSLGYTPYHPL
ncbi:hypothetical protein HHK36_022952 [Tetracentron sinense]|uniref:PWWP domain-containing protein n=1 Tax=Tetracentron sinense TaxID=13715 RepID=A0A834YSU7_TETSI|nr:hypothetical protein HHK36_022952 [Tetracentron sinense]